MTSGFRINTGQDLDDLFDPDTVGDGPSVGGFRKSDGSALRYAAIKYGSKRADVGFRNSDGTDVSNYWAAKGTAVYSMGFNGQTYSDNNQSRGTASIRLLVSANGTWQIQRWRSTSSITTLASGTWLPSGESAANWSCNFDYGLSNSSTIGAGSNGIDCDAPNNGTQYALTSDHYCRPFSQAALTGQNATTNATVILHLYKNGVKRSDSTLYTYTNVNGN